MMRRLEPKSAGGGIPHFRDRRGADETVGRRRRGAGSRAFTLIELMVVCAVMGIILAMGIPAIYSAMHRDPMSQAVVDVVDACQGSLDHAGARSLAILNGKPTELRIFPHERRIEVGGGMSATISDHLYFKMLDVNFIDSRDEDEATVRFYPNGTCDEFNLILESDTGEARRITLDIITGLPEVTTIE
jgi:prepilin-type N-terminal cleavage/methylation domain-containing protein